jgi:hypothetical protein
MGDGRGAIVPTDRSPRRMVLVRRERTVIARRTYGGHVGVRGGQRCCVQRRMGRTMLVTRRRAREGVCSRTSSSRPITGSSLPALASGLGGMRAGERE